MILKTDLENKLNDLEQQLDNKAQEYKDEVLAKLDDISGQLENLQENKLLSIHQTEELRGKVDNHEERLKSLEKVQTSA